MNLLKIKQEIADIAKRLYHNGMVNMFEGNISVRFGDGYLITPSQQSKQDMSADMIIELDSAGNVLNPSCSYRPSSEYKMHLAAYALRPDVCAIVHNHSAYATAFAISGMPIVTRAMPEMLEIFGEVPIVGYGSPGTDRIHEGFGEHLIHHNAVLLANHGLLTVGKTLSEAFSYAEAVEKIAKTLLMVKLLGGERPLEDDEVERLRALGADKRKKDAAK